LRGKDTRMRSGKNRTVCPLKGIKAKISTSVTLVLLVLFTVSSGLFAAPIAPDFEGFPDNTILTIQYPGMTFSNAIVLTAGIGLNEFEFPPFSGLNVASDDGGPIMIIFDTPVPSFVGYFTYLIPLTVTAFDAGSNQVDQVFSLFNSNLACLAGPPCVGDLGSSPNEFLEVAFAGGIASVTITGDPAGFSFTMDGPQAVPEPTSLPILALCIGIIVAIKCYPLIQKS